jgi:hypothetical protein
MGRPIRRRCGYTSLCWLGGSRLRLKCDGTRGETRFRLSAKRTSPFKSAGASVQSTTGNRGVHISGSNAGHTMFRGSVKGTGYPLHSPVSSSLSLPCVTVCHHIATGLYLPLLRHQNIRSVFSAFWLTGNRDRVVSIVTRLRAETPRNHGSISSTSYSSLFQSAGKAAEAWSWPLISM